VDFIYGRTVPYVDDRSVDDIQNFIHILQLTFLPIYQYALKRLAENHTLILVILLSFFKPLQIILSLITIQSYECN